ncbi:cytochrome p450 51b [Colletotrichum asianum]|uniref:Cytochrome p450 51b n=1 Tax=Colletotrichum asianum TaxID=702518 RepID=A0A8H3ZKX1_9PEZI|nr:cytochrome p450 51b [Colletotrichum asianum]
MEELCQEQVCVLGADQSTLKYKDLSKLPFNQAIIKETLPLHAPIYCSIASLSLRGSHHAPARVRGHDAILDAPVLR